MESNLYSGIKSISIFDFDDTLVKSPGPYCSKLIDKLNITGAPKYDEVMENHYIWWDDPISLDLDIFPPIKILGVCDKWEELNEDPQDRTIMITHRVPSMKESVEKVLNECGIYFNESYYGGRTLFKKEDIVSDIIQDTPGVEIIRFFEDSIDHLNEYEKLVKELGIKNYELYYINNRYIYKLDKVNLDLSNKSLVHNSKQEPVK